MAEGRGKSLGNILKRGRVASGLSGLGLVLLLVAGVVQMAAAQPAQQRFDPFWVRGVPVDVTAGGVTEARERAHTEGRVAAFQKLIARMTMPDAAGKIDLPPASQIIEMTYEFSVTNERSSAVRYLADMNVRFNPNAVRRFLRTQGVAYADTASRPLVVIPVLQNGASLQLWEDGSEWKAAWEKLMPHDGLVPMIVPTGDLDDVTLLSAEQAVAKDASALKRIADKYSAAGAIVAVASVSSGGNVTVAVSEVRPLGNPWEGRASSTAALGSVASREEAFLAAATDTANAIEGGWKERNILRYGEGGKLTALIPVGSLAEWASIRNRMSQVPVVEGVELQAVNRNLIQAIVSFAGDETQLQFALNQRDLELQKDGDMWMLRATAREATPAESPTDALPADAPPEMSPTDTAPSAQP